VAIPSAHEWSRECPAMLEASRKKADTLLYTLPIKERIVFLVFLVELIPFWSYIQYLNHKGDPYACAKITIERSYR
jgi:hypothetical protein